MTNVAQLLDGMQSLLTWFCENIVSDQSQSQPQRTQWIRFLKASASFFREQDFELESNSENLWRKMIEVCFKNFYFIYFCL